MGCLKIKNIIYISIIPILLLAFQNCTKAVFSSKESLSIKKSIPSLNSSGNGIGYEGKLVGDFYRTMPNHTCEAMPSSYGEIRVDGKQNANLEINKMDQCLSENAPINYSALEWSTYNAQMLGFLDGIYDRLEEEPDYATKDEFTEVWCSEQESLSVGFDVVIKYKASTNEAQGQLYFGIENGSAPIARVVQPFSLDRIVTDEFVSYNHPAFNLVIDRRQFAPGKIGKFFGTLNATVDLKAQNQTIYCRLGGPLDPAFTQVSFGLVSGAKLTPDGTKVVYLSDADGDGTSDLYVMNVEGTSLTKLGPTLEPGRSINEFKISPDSQTVVFNSDLNTIYVDELFAVNMDGSNFRQINDSLIDQLQKAQSDFQITEDSRFVIYSDGSRTIDFDNGETYSQIVSLDGGVPISLNPYLGFDEGTFTEVINPLKDEIVIIAGGLGKSFFNDSLVMFKYSMASESYIKIYGSQDYSLQTNSIDLYLGFNANSSPKILGDVGKQRIVYKAQNLKPNLSDALYSSYEYLSIALDGSGAISLIESKSPFEDTLISSDIRSPYVVITSYSDTTKVISIDGKKTMIIPEGIHLTIDHLNLFQYQGGSRVYYRSRLGEVYNVKYLDTETGEIVQIPTDHEHLGVVSLFYDKIQDRIFYWTYDLDGLHKTLYSNNMDGTDERVIPNAQFLRSDKYIHLSDDYTKAVYVRDADGDGFEELILEYLNGLGKLTLMESATKFLDIVEADPSLSQIMVKDSGGHLAWIKLK